MQEQNKSNDFDKIISLIIFLLDFISERIFSILKPILLISIISAIVLFVTPNKYSSKVSLIPPNPSYIKTYTSEISALTLNGIPSSIPFSFGMKNPEDIFIEILSSRSILGNIVDKYDLKNVYDKEFKFEAEMKLKSNTEVYFMNHLMYISFTDKDPELSANVTNEYVKQFSELLINVNTNNVRSNKLFLKKRLDEIYQNLKLATEKLTNYRTNYKIFDIQKEGELLIEEVAKIKGQIIFAKSELESAKAIYTNNSSKVKAIKARLNFLNDELKKIRGKSNNSNINVSKNNETIKLLEIPSVSVEYINLLRDVKIQEQVLELVTKEYEVAKIKESKDKLAIKVIDKGVVKQLKSSPNRKLILFLIIVFSFCVILIFELVKYYLNKLKESENKHYFELRKIIRKLVNNIKLRKKE